MLPELTTVCMGLGTTTGIGVKEGKGTATTVAGATTAVASTANTVLDYHYHELIDCYKTETTTAYVQQLSDEELEEALTKYNLLEKDNDIDIKVL